MAGDEGWLRLYVVLFDVVYNDHYTPRHVSEVKHTSSEESPSLAHGVSSLAL